jgi:virginiamycin B lyase
VTVNGVVTPFALDLDTGGPAGITAGPDGHIWFADYGNNAVGRISTGGAFSTLIATPSAVSAPQHITLSPDGLLWFTYSNYNKIGLISQARVKDYFPLNDGSSWTYQVNGTIQTTRSVSPGTLPV